MEIKIAILKIQRHLTPDLLKPRYRELNRKNPMYGHCYVASEALFHIMGGNDSGLTPHWGKDEDKVTHWWLEKSDGTIIDVTADQYYSVGKKPPYSKSRKGAFLIVFLDGVRTKEPSERAKELIKRVYADSE